MNRSVRNRLLLTLLPVTLLVWMVIVAIIYAGTRREVDELIDAQLVQSARILLNVLSHEFYEEDAFRRKVYDHPFSIAQTLGVFSHRYEQKLAFQMWLPPGRLGLRSQSAPDYPMTELANGFTVSYIEGQPWRVYAVTSELDGMQVQVAESIALRNQLRNAIALRILIPMLVALPLLGVLIWIGVGRAMRPLQTIAADVSHRNLEHLSPVSERGVPEEALPLVRALNSLFQRLQRAFENERRFTADAAHELRTPLAALKTQAQVALRASDDAVRNRALQQVIAGVDRATHMVQQLLTLARLDPRRSLALDAEVDLKEISATVLAELAPAALAKDIDLELAAPAACPMYGDAGMLAILVRNLVDNAIKYTQAGGRVRVCLDCGEQGVVLAVQDNGPGIPQALRERVFERFFRDLSHQRPDQSPGTGLGLSIVRRVAELHGARVQLEDAPGGGLEVRVQFARAAAAHRSEAQPESEMESEEGPEGRTAANGDGDGEVAVRDPVRPSGTA